LDRARRQNGERQRHDDDRRHLAGIDDRRQPREKVELRRKEIGVEKLVDQDANGVEIFRERQTERKAGQRAHDADRRADDQEDAQHRAARRAHGAQDGDVLSLVLHEHCQPRDDVEGRHHDDQRQNDEEDIFLDLQRVEKGLVALAPVGDDDRALDRLFDVEAEIVHLLRIGDEGLDDGRLVLLVEEELRLRERHIDEDIVELGHADREDRDDFVSLDPRRDAERRLRALGHEQADRVADADAERLGQPLADGDAARLIETGERAALDVRRDAGEPGQVLLAHAPHEHARLAELGRYSGRALDHRNCKLNARHLCGLC